MKTLHVLCDGQCALCRQCRRWLERQPAFVELRFLPLQSPELACRFPGIERFHPREQLLVVSDEGDVYQGPHAWIMCLWALREYREWSQRLAVRCCCRGRAGRASWCQTTGCRCRRGSAI